MNLTQIVMHSVAVLALIGCATHGSSSKALKSAEIKGKFADSVMVLAWKAQGLADHQRNQWVASWQLRQSEWASHLDTARNSCDSGKALSWNLVKRQKQLNKCQEFSAVLDSKAEAMAAWANLTPVLWKSSDSATLVKGPFALGWKVPSRCSELGAWMAGVPTELRFDSLDVHQRLGLASNIGFILSNLHPDWLDQWNWVREGCQSESRPDPKWYWIESVAWKWWALSAMYLQQIDAEGQKAKAIDSLNKVSKEEFEHSFKTSTSLAECEQSYVQYKSESQLKFSELNKDLQNCMDQKSKSESLIKGLQTPYESLRYMSQSAFHIAPMDSENKVIRIEIADTLFAGIDFKPQLHQQLGRLAGNLSKTDRSIFVLSCDGQTDNGKRAEAIKTSLLLLGMDEIQCLSTMTSSQVPRIEIVLKGS